MLANLLMATGDATRSLHQYKTALYYMPLSGEVTAAATSNRGAMAAAVAHEFAQHLVGRCRLILSNPL